MTDNEIIKSADNETVKQRVKAIYPHIMVSGAIDKPYYNIDWYDIEKNTMYRGFSSYNLELVYKWLEEEFEVVEADIDDLINRQKAEIEALIAGQETLQKYRDEEINRLEIELKAMRGAANSYKAEVERLQKENDVLIETYSKCQIAIIKESIERIKQIVCDHCHPDFNKDGKPINVWDAVNGYKAIDNFFKETAGES